MREVEIQVELSGDRFVLRKLFAVVGSHRVRGLGDGLEHFENSLRDAVGSAPFNLAEQRQSRFALSERDNRLALAFPDDGIHFPVAEPFSPVHNFRSLIDAGAIGEYSTPIVAPVALATLFLTT